MNVGYGWKSDQILPTAGEMSAKPTEGEEAGSAGLPPPAFGLLPLWGEDFPSVRYGS
ncbi:hypothetical protein J2728_003898 [Caulobacter segnis]|nr:hypothetical protein [Caulobacter segnis]